MELAVLTPDDALLLFKLALLLPMGVGYFVWLSSSQKSCVTAGKLRRSHNSWSRFVLKMLPSVAVVPALGRACDTVVGHVELEAELDDDALEIDEAVERNDDALSDGSRLL
jgi:hypothetical protein